MKKIDFPTNLILFLALFFIAAANSAEAQIAYGLSDVVYDSVTKQVTSYSGTYLDYAARFHYDPAVCGTTYQNGIKLNNPVCYTGYNSYYDLPNQRVFGSLVGLRTGFPSPPDTRYDVISHHYIVAYFYTQDIISDDPPTGPRYEKRWYDPMSISGHGGQNTGWYAYPGTIGDYPGEWYEYQYFYLGATGKATIADQTTCPNPASLLTCNTLEKNR